MRNFLIILGLLFVGVLLFGCTDSSPEAQTIRGQISEKSQQITSSVALLDLNKCTSDFYSLVDHNTPVKDLNAKFLECKLISDKMQLDVNSLLSYISSKKGKLGEAFDKELQANTDIISRISLQVTQPISQMQPIADPCSVTQGANCVTQKPACTINSWNCTDWSTCVNSKQTRTCTAPTDCTITAIKPDETKTCISAPSTCTENDWSFTLSPTICPKSGNQTKSWTKKNACTNGISHPATETTSCTYSRPVCTEFTYSDWGPCQPNGTQIRIPITALPEDCANGSPDMQRDCTYSCTVNWTCANWSTCTNGNQTRTCTDQSACGTNSGKPIESQSCASEFDVNACNPFYNWQDGQTYTLTKDISSTITGCFQFNNKTNVTLNCNHLSITNGYSGSRDNTTGIAILQSSGIRIENCDVSLFGNGISITQSPMTIIIDSTIVSNSKNGIYLSDSESCAIQGNQLTNNTNAGLFLFNSKYAAITNNESNMNAYGFYEDLSNIDYQNNQIEFSGNKFGCLHTNTTKDLFGCGSTDYGSSQVSDSSTCASATITGCS